MFGIFIIIEFNIWKQHKNKKTRLIACTWTRQIHDNFQTTADFQMTIPIAGLRTRWTGDMNALYGVLKDERHARVYTYEKQYQPISLIEQQSRYTNVVRCLATATKVLLCVIPIFGEIGKHSYGRQSALCGDSIINLVDEQCAHLHMVSSRLVRPLIELFFRNCVEFMQFNGIRFYPGVFCMLHRSALAIGRSC